ncbi:LacI family DNA-binding transcriptional regulator [Propionicicella superfundia]|uniref:LacI family DNA-binding transcriptional regulator n=1 Tax=Propionicicella superfundia TaxID=348582 RepID=UPI0004017FA3|nr:LacI family DNA-binding transcriptional regulator [Propionicicella superfundia]
MTRPVTIRDVAREASVSVATVSNAMNHPKRVSAPTRERVLEVADRLGYVPHTIANQRKRIGVIAPFVTYTSYAERLKGVLSVVGADRMEAIVFDHPSASRSPSPRLASLPFSGDLDGLIIMGVPVDTDLSARILNRELPTVLVDSGHPQITSIVLDETHGAKLAAEHLVSRGFERFVYVTEGQISKDYVSQGKKRLSGFLRALAERGVGEESVQLITARSGDVRAGHAAAEVVASMSRTMRVGVLAGHDILAAGVLAGLRSTGIAVPDRVGVVGWDGGDLVEALGLTSVRQPLLESGRIGAERLIALIHDENAPVERVVLRPTLREGITT